MKNIEIIEKAKQHGITLSEDSLEFVNMGLDFQVVFGTDSKGQEWVLRFPRREDAYSKIQFEKNILGLVNKGTSVFQAPNWEVFSEELIAYKKLDGVPAVTTNLETQETSWVFDEKNVPSAYTQSMGKALASLHALPKDKAQDAGMTVHSPAELRKSMKQRMNTVREQFEVNDALWTRWRKWIGNEEMWPKETGFIHGDLFPGHTLVDESFSVTGIIDWTEAKVSDISNDFTAYYLLFGEEELDKLIEAYGEAGGYTWPKMKEHIIELLSTQAITIAEFGMSSGLGAYKEAARDMLANGE